MKKITTINQNPTYAYQINIKVEYKNLIFCLLQRQIRLKLTVSGLQDESKQNCYYEKSYYG